MQVRVQKFLSESGVASRRKAEEFVKAGQVFINGKKAKLGNKIDPEVDEVKVYGKVIKPVNKPVYIALNKPKGYVVSRKDPQGRKTIFQLLPKELRAKVWNIGRLDFNTEGLVLLTNDGELTQILAHPKFEREKVYQATVTEVPRAAQLNRLRKGVLIATGPTGPAQIQAKGNVITIAIREGKKHQVRRMLNAVGLSAVKLIRTRIGKLALPNLAPGAYTFVAKSDII